MRTKLRDKQQVLPIKVRQLEYVENINVFKNAQKTVYDEMIDSKYNLQDKSDKNLLSVLEDIPWRKSFYNRQHWGNWLHSMSPYVGRITPAFAHWLIRIFSKKDDLVLDPFCGIGTIPLEADLLGRKTVGIDLNPYAFIITKAKFDRCSQEYLIKYIKNIELDTKNVDLKKVDKFIKQYFHTKTLKEILALVKVLKRDISQNKKGSYFLMGCLLGILHGNRPGYLSAWTGCIIPYPPRKKSDPKFDPKKDIPEYRAVIPRMIAKIKRMYIDSVPEVTSGEVYQEDSRKMPLKDNSVDVIISSPPYYSTLDYSSANRLRLAVLGYDQEKREELAETLIQQRETYLREMLKIGHEVKRVLKNNALCVWILGDMHLTKKTLNTAKDVGELYKNELGFEILRIVNDEIPRRKATYQNSHKKKLDRVIVLRNRK